MPVIGRFLFNRSFEKVSDWLLYSMIIFYHLDKIEVAHFESVGAKGIQQPVITKKRYHRQDFNDPVIGGMQEPLTAP